jgi:large subunit ribosomal protein L29
MRIKEIRNKSIKELTALLAEKREALRAMRFKVSQRQLKKVHEVKQVKKDIARLLTLINQQRVSAERPIVKNKKQTQENN